jgi:hypothetical protein
LALVHPSPSPLHLLAMPQCKTFPLRRLVFPLLRLVFPLLRLEFPLLRLVFPLRRLDRSMPRKPSIQNRPQTPSACVRRSQTPRRDQPRIKQALP